MSLVTKDEGQPVKVIYKSPKREDLLSDYRKMVSEFHKYAEKNGISAEEIKINVKLIGDILVRVDKRKDYFRIYHDTVINEFKETALIAYWIIKFHPFFILNDKKCTLKVNEGFAAFLIFGTIAEYYQRKNISFQLSEEYRNKLLYALKYWDLSKEALIFMVETMCEQGNVNL